MSRTEPPNISTARKKPKRRFSWLSLIGGLISVVCIVWVIRSVEHDRMFEKVRDVKLGFLLATVGITMMSYVLRSARWPLFFRDHKPSFIDSFRCLILGFFMNNVLPARVGEFIRAHLGGRATGASRTTVLATIAGERLADGLTISLIFAVFFSLSAGRAEIEANKELFIVAGLFGLVSICTAIVLAFRHQVFRLIEYLDKKLPGHLSSFGLERARRFVEGLEPIFEPRRLVLISAMSALIWGIELAAYYMVALAFEHSLSLGQTSLFLAAANFASLIPAAPAGIGVIEAVTTTALSQTGLDRESALVMVAVIHLIQIGVIGVPGIYLFFHGLGGKLPEADKDEDEEVVEESTRPTEPAAVPSGEPIASAREVEISIVVPAYNEDERLPRMLDEAISYFRERRARFEILVVDDGSRDSTAERVLAYESSNPEVRLLALPANRGKGYAVKFGMLNAHGALLLFADADGATPIRELERLEEAIASGADIAIGSRAIIRKNTQVQTLWYRKLLGRIYNNFVNACILPGIADTQCGFKLFKRHAAQYVFDRQTADRYSFDVEILFIARKAELRIAEIPVNWTNVAGSKVNLFTDSAVMVKDILRFRLRSVLGHYRRETAAGAPIGDLKLPL